ncbi:MAG: hypothetical protein K2N73_00400, partial [Lachnospiraceae bacterium]|nr:hypothetical protein [Lachnospiraceae bacterium]
MHRKVKGLLSLILTLAMVTVSAAPASAEGQSAEQPTTEQQMVEEMTETEPETAELDEIEAESTLVPVEKTLIAETADEETESVERNAAEPVSDSGQDLDNLYDSLTAEQKQFRVYAGTDISSELTFMDNGITPDSANLDAQGGTIVRTLLKSREGDLKFYRLSGWNVWKVDSTGAPERILIASKSPLLSRTATANNFKQSAYLENSTTAAVICQKPILEPVWSCLDYTIPVYDINGNDTGATITINAENYSDSSQVAFPAVEVNSWKLIYNGTECLLNAASEIWTNEINGIRTIGTDFDASLARLQAVSSQTVLQPGNAEFMQPDWYEGQPKPEPIVSSETNGIENITYYYKEAEADDSTYTTTVPDKAGAYTAKAVFAATEIYEEVVKTADFHILPAQVILQEGTAEFAQPDWYEGQPMTPPVVSSETNGIEHITYYYKEAEADDSTYTTTVPDKAGAYTAKAVFAATEIYKEVVKTADFHILPVQVILQEGTAEFEQPDWYEGQPKPEPIVSSETNGIEHI